MAWQLIKFDSLNQKTITLLDIYMYDSVPKNNDAHITFHFAQIYYIILKTKGTHHY